MCLNYVSKLINEACHDKVNCLCTIACLYTFVLLCLTMGTHKNTNCSNYKYIQCVLCLSA